MEELIILITEVTSYFVFAGLSYFIFYVLLKNVIETRIIQKKFEKKEQMLMEIKYSLSSLVIFSLVFSFVYYLQGKGLTRHYADVEEYGVPYLFLSAFMMIVLHDAYFYWAHRLMHHPKIYKHVHLIHHKSTNPSPWAAYCFHPIEAFAEIGILFFIVFLIPYNEISIAMWWAYMLFFNVMGHLGVELFPKFFYDLGILKIQNSAVHHNMHHKYFNYNYGLFFNVWDGLMKTVHPKYYETFIEVTTRGDRLKEAEELQSLARVEDEKKTPAHVNQENRHVA